MWSMNKYREESILYVAWFSPLVCSIFCIVHKEARNFHFTKRTRSFAPEVARVDARGSTVHNQIRNFHFTKCARSFAPEVARVDARGLTVYKQVRNFNSTTCARSFAPEVCGLASLDRYAVRRLHATAVHYSWVGARRYCDEEWRDSALASASLQ